MKHNAAIRKLARSWVRILYRVWHSGMLFDCDLYLKRLLTNNPDLANFLHSPKTTAQPS